MIRFLLLLLFATQWAIGQSIDQDQISALLKAQGAGEVNLDGIDQSSIIEMNPLLRQMVLDSLVARQKMHMGKGLDSTLFLFPDTVLASPADSMGDSLAPVESKRYIRKIFSGEKNGLFGSVTSNVGGDYPLKAGDALQLVLWGDVEKVYEVQVNNQGKLLIDGAGMVAINGLTLKGAETLLKKKLSKVHASLRSGRTQLALVLQNLSPVKIFIAGEVTQPGGYVFHGNTSVLLGLYYAQGPTEFGSVRKILINRNGDSLWVDLYDFLFKGQRAEGSILLDGDVVYLPRAERLVEVDGDVGRPGIYELKAEEGVKELLRYAGGVNPSASDNPMTLRRYFAKGKLDMMNLKPVSFYLEEGETFEFKDGDQLFVPKSTEGMQNIVTVFGAVKYPNTYELPANATVKQVIQLAGGPAEDAYLDRVQIIRRRVSGDTELLSYSLLDTNTTQLELQGRDTLLVFSQKDFYQPDSVEVTGAVKKPGTYPYYQNMTVKDLILIAGGNLPYAQAGALRLERLPLDGDAVEIFKLESNAEYTSGDVNLMLKPRDRLVLLVDPQFKTQEVIHVRGSFIQPGDYSLKESGESLQSFMRRVGFVTDVAYLGGARFYRYPGDHDILAVKEKEEREQLALDFVAALRGDEEHNIRLKGGDSIFVPDRKVWVKVRGEVGSPTNVLFRPGEDIYYYISRAGGFTPHSDENRIIITYANGAKMATDNGYESPDPGAEIFVPKVPISPPTNWLGVTQAVASIFSAVLLPIILLELKK